MKKIFLILYIIIISVISLQLLLFDIFFGFAALMSFLKGPWDDDFIIGFTILLIAFIIYFVVLYINIKSIKRSLKLVKNQPISRSDIVYIVLSILTSTLLIVRP